MTLSPALERALGKLPTRSLASLAFFGLLAFALWANSEQGFARTERLKAMEIRALEADLIDTTIAVCQAPTRFLAERQQTLRRQYQMLTGVEWRIPSCRELGQKP